MHFALDQNFPALVQQIPWPATIELTRLGQIDPDLTRAHEDWQVLLALARRGGIDGFITNDDGILKLSREMVALTRTRLHLIVTPKQGHQPVRAVALIMLHLEEIVRRARGRSGPLIYRLAASRLGPALTPGQQIDRLASRTGEAPNVLISRELEAIEGGHPAS